MSMTQAPVRELRVLPDTRIYVSDAGFMVIEQACGDTVAVYFEAAGIDDVVAGLCALRESAMARRAMTESLESAEYDAWQAMGGKPA